MRDALPAAERLLTAVIRNPVFIAMLVAAPIVLVLIFGFIFGGAIALPGADGGAAYREFLLPGLLVTIAFNIVPSMVTCAKDAHSGITDRFRAMPISRPAVPAGQALANLVYGTVSFAIMMLCGLAVGWRIRGGVTDALLACGLLLLCQFSVTWIGMYLGYLIGDEETAGQASILVLPAGMISNVFVPTTGMPGWLATIAAWNPMSAVSASLRELFGNPTVPAEGAWPLEHPVTASLLWAVGLLAVFVPLCTLRYVRAGR